MVWNLLEERQNPPNPHPSNDEMNECFVLELEDRKNEGTENAANGWKLAAKGGIKKVDWLD